MNQRYVYGLAGFLAALGFAVFLYRWQVLGFPVSQRQEVAYRFRRNQQSGAWDIVEEG